MKVIPELISRNWTLKLTALALAVLLWTVTRAETPRRTAIRDVPVVVELHDPEWALAAEPTPATVTVVFSGPAGELLGLFGEQPRVVVPVDDVRDSIEVRSLRAGLVRLDGSPERTRVVDVMPSTVRLFFTRLATRRVPVLPRIRGELPAGIELFGRITIDPAAVSVSGPAQRVERLDAIPLEPFELGGIVEPTAISVALDTAGLGGLTISPTRVDVIIPAGRARMDTLLDQPTDSFPAPVPPAMPPDTVAPADTLLLSGPIPSGNGNTGTSEGPQQLSVAPSRPLRSFAERA